MHGDLFLVVSIITQKASECQNTFKCVFIWNMSKTEIKPNSYLDLSNISQAVSQLRDCLLVPSCKSNWTNFPA